MRRILIIRNDRFGEFLLNVPAFRAVKETYPACALTAAVAPGVADVARGVPYIDKVIEFPSAPMGLAGQLRFVMKLRREKFDAAAVLNPTAIAHRSIFLAGIPLRAGYARKHPFFLTNTIPDVKGEGRRHEVLNNLGVAALLGCSTQDLSLTLNIPPLLQREALSRFGLTGQGIYAAVHPWTSDAVKQWPLERFTQLIAALARQVGVTVVIIGRPEPWHEPFIVPAAANIIDLRGQTSLMEAGAVLKCCAVLVSCDSGPVHLAASVGTPVVALFRNDMPGKNPERWGPWGPGHAVIQRAQLNNISVEDVIGIVSDKIYGKCN
jgi:ADP-heptose:LPS heptosyltransferase